MSEPEPLAIWEGPPVTSSKPRHFIPTPGKLSTALPRLSGTEGGVSDALQPYTLDSADERQEQLDKALGALNAGPIHEPLVRAAQTFEELKELPPPPRTVPLPNDPITAETWVKIVQLLTSQCLFGSRSVDQYRLAMDYMESVAEHHLESGWATPAEEDGFWKQMYVMATEFRGEVTEF